MVYICNTEASSETIRTKSSNIDIDDFINRLLSSQKFDELADKVADKAVKKLKAGNPLERLERFIAPNNVTIQGKEKGYKDHEKESSYRDASSRDEGLQFSKLGKINTEALMRDEIEEQSEHLQLKFKYLTKNAHEKKAMKDRTPDGQHNQQTGNNEGYNQDDGENSARNPSSYDEGSRGRYKHKSRNENEPQRSGAGVFREDGRPRHPSKSERNGQNSRPEFKSVAKKQKSASDDDEEKGESESSAEEISKELANVEGFEKSDKSKEEMQELKEVYEKSGEEKGQLEEIDEFNPLFRAHEKTEPNVEANKVASDYHATEGSAEITSTTKKTVVRQEGNKVYGFPEGESYEDYREQYAKLQKEKENNTPFPIL